MKTNRIIVHLFPLFLCLCSCASTNSVDPQLTESTLPSTSKPARTQTIFYHNNTKYHKALEQINRLKKENHLLRVEIDVIKRKLAIFEALSKTKKAVTNLQSKLKCDE